MKPDHCPTCESPSPERHPAVQFEGEAQICPDPWHSDGSSAVMKRARVLEWRVTTQWRGLLIRWWIESAPEFGGASDMLVARVRVAEAQVKLGPGPADPKLVAEALLEACEAANSVEVCNSLGDGVAVHRDWP